jgi:isoleucyl-tRNA synthetase
MEDASLHEKDKDVGLSGREVRIGDMWEREDTFGASFRAREGKDTYVFYDGPPFATGMPHYGHLLQGAIKDAIPRYQTMRGRYVRREWGWDCHGLPIENLIEKDLGFTQKSDIETYGIGAFNDKARESVLRYDSEWKAIVPRMGRWVDMEHAYKTMDAAYTESVWWAFATLYGKKLIYEGFKSMHICPRCETTLAASEVALAYKDIKDISVYVAFSRVDMPDTALVAWTTTPWTLPGNVALAVNPDVTYVTILLEGKKYQMGKDVLARVVKDKEYTILEEFLGSALVGAAYRPVFDTYVNDTTLPGHAIAWHVVSGSFVTAESGTGIVHIAPAFGEDDMHLAKELGLPLIQHVGMNGKMKPEVTQFAGMPVKPKSDDDKERLATDIAVLRYLQEQGSFFAKENIVHSYPHCWRCDTPLLNYAAGNWFVNVTALKPRLIAANQEVNWVPDHAKDGRFGKWLEGARDWAISRSRYWGAPLPVWKCDSCATPTIVGSVNDLRQHMGERNTYTMMRHGEADSNVRGIVSYKPEDDVHLTERGRAQVKKYAEGLKGSGIDVIIASPVLRTKETARIVAETLGIPVEQIVYDARIAEVNTGDFSGCSIETYRTFFTSTLEKFTKRSPGGENLTEMKKRIAECLYETDHAYQGKHILYVTHEYGTWMMDAVTHGATNEEAAMMRAEGGDDYVNYGETKSLPFVSLPHNTSFELDLHRPYIDEITFACKSCEGGVMRRIPEVFDCWFESGSMPYAQFHYLGDETTTAGRMFVRNFPADFISEGADQTRGWFYSMLVLSMGLFDKSPFKSVVMTGLILAEDGQKMSKKLKNYPDPLELASKYGADALRLYMLGSPVVRGEELLFSPSGVEEVVKKVTLKIDNVRSFYELFSEGVMVPRKLSERTHVLDKWIVARFQEMHAEVTHHLDTHELDRAVRPLAPFIDDLSTWYVRRSRDRFKSGDSEDKAKAIETLGYVLIETSKVLAPFMPFLAEDLYQRIALESKRKSVHHEDWPAMGISPHTVLEDMERARAIVTMALELRAKAGIKIRQPLASLTAPLIPPALAQIVADEVNVKEVFVGDTVILDTVITPELKREGEIRDLVRMVQDMRKKHGLSPSDAIVLVVPRDQMDLAQSGMATLTLVAGVTALAEGDTLGIQS